MTLKIAVEPDATIEPGQQWIVLPDTPDGQALARLLTGGVVFIRRDKHILVPHEEKVDQEIVGLINALGYIRYQSPAMVQLILMADEEQPG